MTKTTILKTTNVREPPITGASQVLYLLGWGAGICQRCASKQGAGGRESRISPGAVSSLSQWDSSSESLTCRRGCIQNLQSVLSKLFHSSTPPNQSMGEFHIVYTAQGYEEIRLLLHFSCSGFTGVHNMDLKNNKCHAEMALKQFPAAQVVLCLSASVASWHILQSHFLARGDVYQHKTTVFTNQKFRKEGLRCSRRGVPLVLWQMLLYNGRLDKFFAAIPWVTTAETESEKHTVLIGVYFLHVCLTRVLKLTIS